MATFYESFGSFSSGVPSYRQLVSKKSKGTITLTETFLSFESQVDKILFQVRLSEIQDILMKNRSNINLIEILAPHQTIYTLYPMKKKNNSYNPSKEMTIELFGQLTRLIFNKNQSIIFDAIGSFYLGSLRSYDLKEMMIQGQIFLTENYILFKSFHSEGIYKIKILDFKEVTMEIENSIIYVKIETTDGNTYSIFPLRRLRRKLVKDKVKTEKFYDLLHQAKMYKESEHLRSRKDERESLKKLKTMLNVSSRLKLKMIRTTLGLEKESFNNLIFEWAKKFEFTIDGKHLIVNKETISAFITHLKSLESDHQDDVKDNEMKCYFCGNLIDFKAEFCPYCGNKN
ncbi:MAG: hypothetical protein ACW98A_13705 [Candidatus Hodarchaeales archaeon]|jgi:hypothetical protein